MKKRVPKNEWIPYPFHCHPHYLPEEVARSLFYDSPMPEDDDLLLDYDGIISLYLSDPFFDEYRSHQVDIVRDHIDKTISAYLCPTWYAYPEETEDQ